MKRVLFGLVLFAILFGLSGCLWTYSQGPDHAVIGVYSGYHYHAPFWDYPPYPPPAYRPDSMGYWKWHHREYVWQPGF